jgi:hypothetical protein
MVLQSPKHPSWRLNTSVEQYKIFEHNRLSLANIYNNSQVQIFCLIPYPKRLDSERGEIEFYIKIGLSCTLMWYFFFSFLKWGDTESTWYCGHYWPIIPDPDDR